MILQSIHCMLYSQCGYIHFRVKGGCSMINGFPNAFNQFVEKRLEDIMASEEYDLFFEEIYQDLEYKLSSNIENLDENAKRDFIEDLKSNVFQQVFQQGKITYHTAFQDALSLLTNRFMLPKK